MSLLLLAAQSLILRWGLSPLRHVADELTRLEQGQQEQIEGDYPTEVRRLTDNLNTLVTHERAQQKRYRDALADLAHSLKTPLALVRGALSKAKPERGTRSQLSTEQVERMDHIVGYHLQRAATSGRSRAGCAASRYDRRWSGCSKALAKVHADKRDRNRSGDRSEVRFRGDDGDLMETARQRARQCLQVVPEQGARQLRTVSEGQLSLTVEDDGPGIADADAERVLQRGIRADQSCQDTASVWRSHATSSKRTAGASSSRAARSVAPRSRWCFLELLADRSGRAKASRDTGWPSSRPQHRSSGCRRLRLRSTPLRHRPQGKRASSPAISMSEFEGETISTQISGARG